MNENTFSNESPKTVQLIDGRKMYVTSGLTEEESCVAGGTPPRLILVTSLEGDREDHDEFGEGANDEQVVFDTIAALGARVEKIEDIINTTAHLQREACIIQFNETGHDSAIHETALIEMGEVLAVVEDTEHVE